MSALDAAYRRYGPQVYRRCLRLLRDEAEAEDAAHEVFLRALDRLPAAEEEAMAWLYRVSTNYCLNRLRNRRMREQRSWREAVTDTLARAERSPESVAVERELTLHLLGEADDQTQAIAVYYWVDGMSQGEIAQVVGLARGTVNRKLRDFARLAAARMAEVTG